MSNPITLVLGASENPERYSFKAITMLRHYEHKVVAIGLKNGKVADITFDLQIPDGLKPDTVTLYIGPAHQKEYYDSIISLKPRRVIFNPGTENAELEQKLKQAGINAIEACTLVMLSTGQY